MLDLVVPVSILVWACEFGTLVVWCMSGLSGEESEGRKDASDIDTREASPTRHFKINKGIVISLGMRLWRPSLDDIGTMPYLGIFGSIPLFDTLSHLIIIAY